MDSIDQHEKIKSLLDAHEDFIEGAIPLIASENIISPSVKKALTSDFGHRYAEGWPGERVYAGCEYIDQVELICMELAKKYFNGSFADVRPISGVVANLISYTAISNPGDTMLCMKIPNGGHISHNITARNVHGLKVEYLDFDESQMNLMIESNSEKIKKFKPRIVLFGASVFLFPHPVQLHLLKNWVWETH